MKPKIKNSFLYNNHQDGGLENVNRSKIISLRCACVIRVFDCNMYNRILLPLALIHKYLGKEYKFHSN